MLASAGPPRARFSTLALILGLGLVPGISVVDESQAQQGTAPVAPYHSNSPINTLSRGGPGATAPPLRERGAGFVAPHAAHGADALWAQGEATAELSGASVQPIEFAIANPNFEGMDTNGQPPDTNGAVGRNHYIQTVNASFFAIYDKQGALLAGPTNMQQLWIDAGAPANDDCRVRGRGDPYVVYDHLADRWVLTQFANKDTNAGDPLNIQCIAVGQGPDPVNDGWFVYTFDLGFSNDYPKLAVWPDGYYLVTQQGYNGNPIDVTVFDRATMLNGGAATFQTKSLGGPPTIIALPSELEGAPPAPGTPNFYVRMVDGALFGGNDRIEVREFHVDWGVPANTSFGNLQTLTPSGFSSDICAGANLFNNCIDQPGAFPDKQALSVWPMAPANYRNFGSYESLVFNHTVDVDGNGLAGIRWYELRRVAGVWSIHQEGTYSPPDGTSTHRWMGSIGMDQVGNIALGYSVSNATNVFPGIRYAGRLATDPLGLLPQGENTLVAGSTSTGGTRWGDYSAMRVDPVDGCTFWYTTEWNDTDGQTTQIGAFRFPTCNPADLEIVKSAPVDVFAGNEIIYTIEVWNHGPSTATDVTVVDTLPGGVTYLADTDDCTEGPPGTLTCNLGDLADGQHAEFTIKVAVDANIVVLNNGPIGLINTATVSAEELDPFELNNTATAGTLVQDESDLAVVKVCKPDRELLAGQTGTCTVVVDNFGPSYARDVVVLDSMVSDGLFEVTSAQVVDGANCAVTPNDSDPHDRFRVVCNVGNLEPADVAATGRELIQVEVVALEQLDINDVSRAVSTMTPDPDISNNTSVGSLAVTALADLVLAKGGPATAIAGAPGDIVYTLTVQNNGPSTAVNVVLEDVVPAGTSIDSVAVTMGAGACNAGVPGDPFLPTTCDLGTMASGDSREVQIVATVLPDTPAGTILHNDGRVSSDTLDLENANNLDSADTTVVADADLEVVKSDSPDPVVAGDPLIYEVVVTNNGPSKAIDVAIVDLLPTEVTFVGTTVSNGSGTCVWLDAPSRVECDLNDLGPGASVTIFIDVIVNSDTPAGTITDNVSVSAATPDSNAGNDSDSEDTSVVTEADLEVLKDANFAAGNPSTEIIYTITVTNDGPSDAQNVMVVDTLPLSGTKKQSKVVFLFETSNGACTHDLATNVVTCECSASAPPPWCTLAAGESISFDILVDTKGNLGTITNNVVVSSDTTDPNGLNDEANKDLLIQGGTGNPGGPGGGRGR